MVTKSKFKSVHMGVDYMICYFDVSLIHLFKANYNVSLGEFVALFEQLTETELLASMVESVFHDRFPELAKGGSNGIR